MRVIILVTHLLGTGHLARAVTLAEAFGAEHHDVVVASGGTSVPRLENRGVRIVQLPPVRSDGVDFSRLLKANGQPVDPEFMAQRQKQLLDVFTDDQPDVLITELFPFGRRILREEFRAVLEAAENSERKPLICASIRDILAPPGAEKKRLFAQEMIAQHYHAVLVHSDAEITPLDLSWPVTDSIRALLHYTGFVAPPPAGAHPDRLGHGEILVSAGGGDVGDRLFACARDAAALMPDYRWRILVGGRTAHDRIATLQRDAPPNVIIEPARDDFRQMLYHATASVSFCGYNTALDLLQSGCPGVLVPFNDGNEVEQSIRAQALARQEGFTVISSQDLTARTLADRVAPIISARRPTANHRLADGALTTVRIVEDLRNAHAEI
ncbi:Glycosyltransferase 28 domain [Sulfitobacter noctilucae]|uniref:glycosyltransferase family protein n=1 Tax=Sulfitobacter noctilucae TaxID=1342302 RepID=UPI00046A5396|nr:glycosyltransferase [Sulfitobacter noctilucae]KIN70530.1 Glycosyltransferase 28 domain [Sulfitobacter noctilucae]